MMSQTPISFDELQNLNGQIKDAEKDLDNSKKPAVRSVLFREQLKRSTDEIGKLRDKFHGRGNA